MCERFGSQYAASFAAVPEYVFAPGFRELITTPSGNQLMCEVDNELINIYDPTSFVNVQVDADGQSDPTFRFTAYLLREQVWSSPRFALYVRTRDPLSDTPHLRHPDLHSFCLARRALDFFEARKEVLTMETKWLEYMRGLPVAADMWNEYHGNLAALTRGRRLGRRLTGADKAEAARRTRSGQWAARLGFAELMSLDDTDGGPVVCVFSKPWWKDYHEELVPAPRDGRWL